jgi:peptidoglycan/xylan/chitin deacetylase (PgdA/CDA1 family)
MPDAPQHRADAGAQRIGLSAISVVCEAAVAAGWEFMGHGFVQMPMHSLEDQRGAIRRTVEAITAFTGRSPRGWESPGLTETLDTAIC